MVFGARATSAPGNGRAVVFPVGNWGHSRYTAPMKTLRPLVLALACVLPALASAQWLWLEKDGRKVFSDRPPPADIPANRVLKQPGSRAVAAPTEGADAASGTSTAAGAPAAAGSAPKLAVSGKDKELEEKKKQADAAEAEKKKAQDSKVAAARIENCNRAKQSKASFDSGQRIARTNEKGEREYLDDNDRAVEVKRLEGVIARDCK